MKTRAAYKTKWDELAALAASGMLKAASVVEYAREPSTHLHKCFEWNDSEAAKQYRLDQARHQIRAYVLVVEGPRGPVEVRAFHSLPNDRVAPGGGYRRTTDILQDEELVAELVRSFMRDLALVRARYEVVAELAPVWALAEEIAARVVPSAARTTTAQPEARA